MSQIQVAQSKLETLKKEALEKIQAAPSSQALYQVKVEYWGKSGHVTEIMKEMAALPKEDKPGFGKLVNEVKQALEEAYVKAEDGLKVKEIEARMQSEELDLTLPGVPRAVGSEHPVSSVTNEIVAILGRLGYSLRQGPLIESDFYNFEALNIPKNHPARDMQDTFFVDQTHVLRTHTSPIQVHVYQSEKPPLRLIGTGAVFRCDSDISHLPHFHQIEGICVDEKVSMADLKGTISFFVKEFFGASLAVRFRPSFFPFTEPSAEVDCQCPICKGNGCSLCKQSGWIEIGGCGLVNPKVFEQSNIDTSKWQGFAFGFGIERMAIIKYGITDIRLFPENDLRFLGQFVTGGAL
ncbi:MAG: phenylalanine--tRNA ligase subunit alpha [Bdellovibrionaceae bacterium]|nr:phenylalanine--tRNA ligase subunit alpha [Pseudobdellovibrionaceae bacterium]